MLPKTEANLLAALQCFPAGGTAKQVASSLGWQSLTTSQRLGHLFFSSKIDRHLVDVTRRRTTEYVYKLKPPKQQPSPPSQWQPDVTRTAASMIRERVE